MFFICCKKKYISFFADHIAASLGMEIKRMQRRKQLHYPGCTTPPNMSPPHESCSSSSMDGAASPSSSGTLFSALSPNKRDTPLFTFKQVSMICERMLKEREEEIKSEYNSVLTSKLAGTKLSYMLLLLKYLMLLKLIVVKLTTIT